MEICKALFQHRWLYYQHQTRERWQPGHRCRERNTNCIIGPADNDAEETEERVGLLGWQWVGEGYIHHPTHLILSPPTQHYPTIKCCNIQGNDGIETITETEPKILEVIKQKILQATYDSELGITQGCDIYQRNKSENSSGLLQPLHS
nr:hypothetical protein Iba_chr12dCG4410 [Ipomoea batatas]